MNRPYLIVLSLLFCLFLSACCSTTGDPTKGGLLCWRESKTQDEINAARQALEAEKKKATALDIERQELERKIMVAKNNLAALEKEIANSSSSPSVAEAERIRQMKKEIAKLKNDIAVLEKEAQVLKSVFQ